MEDFRNILSFFLHIYPTKNDVIHFDQAFLDPSNLDFPHYYRESDFVILNGQISSRWIGIIARCFLEHETAKNCGVAIECHYPRTFVWESSSHWGEKS
jgi:hypothetical protein